MGIVHVVNSRHNALKEMSIVVTEGEALQKDIEYAKEVGSNQGPIPEITAGRNFNSSWKCGIRRYGVRGMKLLSAHVQGLS